MAKSADLAGALATLYVPGAIVGLRKAFVTEGIAFKLGAATDRALAVGDALEVLGLGLGGLLLGQSDDATALDDHHAPAVAVWARSAVPTESAASTASLAVIDR